MPPSQEVQIDDAIAADEICRYVYSSISSRIAIASVVVLMADAY